MELQYYCMHYYNYPCKYYWYKDLDVLLYHKYMILLYLYKYYRGINVRFR